jgi:hypothetical protein
VVAHGRSAGVRARGGAGAAAFTPPLDDQTTAGSIRLKSFRSFPPTSNKLSDGQKK